MLFQKMANKVEELKAITQQILQNPRRLSTLLEEKSPWLGEQVRKELLSAASNFSDPFLVGMGLQIEKMNEDGLEVRLPQRWKNSAGGGFVHIGALCAAAEFTSRVYWERHLNPAGCESRVVNLQCHFLRAAQNSIKIIYHIGDAEREALLFRVRNEESVSFESLVVIYDDEEQLICEATIDWNFRRKNILGSGSNEFA
jgi:acyl-coenzyme A thioesterase PaaI-like protein